MKEKNITIETIESDVDRLLEDVETFVDHSGRTWVRINKCNLGNRNRKRKGEFIKRQYALRDKSDYYDKSRKYSAPEYKKLTVSIRELSCAIKRKTQEIDRIRARIDVISSKDDSFQREGATGEEIMSALSSLSKLSDKALLAIEAGSKEMRDMPMPDSAWD